MICASSVLGRARHIRITRRAKSFVRIFMGVNNDDFERAVQVIYDRFVRDEMVTAS